MTTVREVILLSQQKKDGTWNVKIRIYHKGKIFYIQTQHFIGRKQLRSDNTIKDAIILNAVNPVVNGYRLKISQLGPTLESYNIAQLVDYLTGSSIKTSSQINIIEFGRKKIEKLNAAGRKASASNMRTVINSLIDYFKVDFVPITEIRAKMLLDYENYLCKERSITRINRFGQPYTRIVAGISRIGLHNHMRDLRILFNNIRDYYNDEDFDIKVVDHYPFKKYKIIKIFENNKPKLTIEQVISIKDFNAPKNSRMELAKDLFMLSFYSCGMNAADLYKLKINETSKERVNYNRSKTKSRRRDQAYISIKIPKIAKPLYMKYAGKLQIRYSTHLSLDHALGKGMRKMNETLAIPNLNFYCARHAFGDWARNKCRFSKDDVGLALNHKDQTNSVTDIYISKNWDIIDEIQMKVIKLLINHKIKGPNR